MNWQKVLNREGYRLTQARRTILAVLEAAGEPLSPQKIHESSQTHHKKIGLVSVYRTLNLLTDLDLVRRVHGRDGCHGYVLASPGHHHHLICQHCEKAIEFSGSGDLSQLIQRIQDKTGFEINDHLLQLYGLCPNCQKKGRKPFHP